MQSTRLISVKFAILITYLCINGFAQNYDSPIYRLPSQIIPMHYIISLTPEIVPPFSLHGEVHIRFQTVNETLEEPINEIVLHMGEDLQLLENNVRLVDESNSLVEIGSIENDDHNQLLIIKTITTLFYGQIFTIYLPFKGYLRKDEKGLYMKSFTNTSDMYISSNFYPIQARLAFPCFDEPGFKSTFQMTVVRPEGYTAIFNSPVYDSKEISVGRISESFLTTPNLATNSLSLFIGKMLTTRYNIGTMDAIIFHQGVFALPSTNNLFHNLTFITNTLLSYSINRIKIILLPNLDTDILGGYGIMYFNDNFFDISTLTITEELNRYQIYLEQLLKQYFTFLVTPVWWSDIWLSKGIAAFVQYLVIDQVATVLPGFHRSEMLIDIRQKAMKLDVLSRPLADKRVQSSQEILSATADVLKKYKGALILIMLEQSLPTGILMKTLNRFLTNKLYKTVNTEYFISILNSTMTNYKNAANVTLGLESWFYKSGYPLVTVERRNFTVILTQETFCQNTSQCQRENATGWKIPINFTTKDKVISSWLATSTDIWLDVEPLILQESISDTSWLVLNTQSQGYYRINYPSHDLELIKEMLKSVNFNSLSRGQIADDIMTLAAQGVVNYSIALDIVTCYKNESNYFVLKVLLKSLDLIGIILHNEGFYENFQVFILGLLDGATTHSNTYLFPLIDSLITQWICAATSCNKYKQIAKEFISGEYEWSNTVTKIQFHEYICAGIRFNNEIIYQDLINGYISSMNTSYHEYFVTGVGCMTGKQNLERLLQNLVEPISMIAKRDVKSILSRLTSITENTNDILKFVTNEVILLEELYGERLLIDIISEIGEKLSEENHADKLNFLATATNVSSGVKKIAKETLENVRKRIKIISSYKAEIMKYFENINIKNISPTSSTGPVPEFVANTFSFDSDISTTHFPSAANYRKIYVYLTVFLPVTLQFTFNLNNKFL